MDKARTVTDTKTLWEEDSDKRNTCSASICLNYCHFRVHVVLPTFAVLTFFVWTVKTTLAECFPMQFG